MTIAIIDDIIEAASKTGTFSMQVLLMFFIIGLAAAVVWMHMDFRRLMRIQSEEFKTDRAKMDLERLQMTDERRGRIDMLMDVIRKDTEVKRDLAHALNNNTEAIRDLKALIK